jgi:hypothetical protein
MVVGILKVEKTTKVKNNTFYGNYEIKDTYTHHIVNEKYVGLVSPKNGIHIVVKTEVDGDTLDITIGKYVFTGEREKDYDEDTEFSTSFGFSGHIYEVSVDFNGQLICVDEWYSYSDFEDGNEPDNHWKKNSKGIKWELVNL